MWIAVSGAHLKKKQLHLIWNCVKRIKFVSSYLISCFSLHSTALRFAINISLFHLKYAISHTKKIPFLIQHHHIYPLLIQLTFATQFWSKFSSSRLKYAKCSTPSRMYAFYSPTKTLFPFVNLNKKYSE